MTTTDVRDDTLGFGGLLSQDLAAGSVGTSEVADNSLGNGDFLSGSVDSRVATNNSLTGGDIANDSLTGTDINESTLNLPPSTTATFAAPSGAVSVSDAFTKIVGKSLPAGSYAIIATANIDHGVNAAGTRDTVCELRSGSNFIGGATDRRDKVDGQHSGISLSMNGGAQVPGGGGEVSLWCRYQDATGSFTNVTYGQMMIIRLAGFF